MNDIEQRIEDLETQSKRFVSHLESERRVYSQHGQRLTEQGITIQMINENLKEIKADVKQIDNALRNSNGITMRIDRLEQQQKSNDSRQDKWIAVIAVLISLGATLLQLLK